MFTLRNYEANEINRKQINCTLLHFGNYKCVYENEMCLHASDMFLFGNDFFLANDMFPFENEMCLLASGMFLIRGDMFVFEVTGSCL